MKFIDKPAGCFCDRSVSDPKLEPIDVIMMTLDAENFLEKSLYTVYREIPVKRLIVCDGGSNDSTIKILENFPRTEIHIKSEFKTGAKSLEFLIIESDNCEYLKLEDTKFELFISLYIFFKINTK